MNGNRLSPRDYQIFLLKSFLWLFLAWGSFVSALAGYFYSWLIWPVFFLAIFVMARQVFRHEIIIKPSREMWLASFAFIFLATLFTFFSTPTVFTGRDQGAISEAAIRLSQNHKFTFQTPTSLAFFKLHEKGRAQNFPGFYYTSNGSLITQFPLVYITWLALFFSVFGLWGFAIANAILFFFFLLSFYLIVRLFVDTFSALPLTIFSATSFVFMWFAKYTLSENMALPLLWLGILSLMLFLKNPRKLFYLVFLISAFLLCFTRIEGFAFLLFSFAVLFCHEEARTYIKRKSFSRIFLPAIFFLFVFVANFLLDSNFYRELIKAILPTVATPQAQYLGNLKNAILPDFYLEKIFYLYGMLGFFVFGAFSIAYYLWKKDWYKLAPFFVILPTFAYFFNSHISSDHPWMLRRFMFSLLPVTIFYSGLFIGELIETKSQKMNYKLLAFALSLLLVLGNLPAFSKYLFYSENQELLAQTQKISQEFSDKDLVLVDQNATENGWAMISGPMNSLFAKNAVYFFNIADLSKLDLKAFEKIYLISPNKQTSFYLSSTLGKRLSVKSDYTLNFTQLNSVQTDPLETLKLPEKKDMRVQGKIFEVSK